MKAKRVWIPVAVLAATLAAGAANAHPGHGKHYDYRPHQSDPWHGPKRSKRMPDWLYYKPHFRRWYHRSAVKYERHLAWRQVYRIYKRQMASRYYRHNQRYSYGYEPYYRDDDRHDGWRHDRRNRHDRHEHDDYHERDDRHDRDDRDGKRRHKRS